ncbi:hypothetical protein SAMN03159343_0192 [Klenkia marina]|uniref:Gram-positive cocci surface proteins LPxTG domain-containing protein n=1 Tax=Klenkia marina TaxID=1960309 RepID=A0A1G4X9A5_9ACTN|nr:hypothetical protein SAMN03159343_0192 [Klenkia marina]
MVVSGTELADGTEVVVQVLLPGGTVDVPSLVVDGGIPVRIAPEVLDGVTELTLGVLVGDQAFGPYVVQVPAAADACTAQAAISLARDCTAPDAVLATVDVRGLTPGVYGIGVVGETADGGVVELASQDVEVTGTGFAGTLPLVSLSGSVPLSGFVGVALVVDGRTLATIGGDDVELGACTAPQPLPVAPAPPVVTSPAPVVPVSAHPARPAALASTGAEPAGLLLLAGLFLGLGGLTTFVARRSAR